MIKKSNTNKSNKQSKAKSEFVPLEEESFVQAAECLKLLAHPSRLRMVQMLLHDRYTVGELAEACGIKSHQASEHLRLMQHCGFLDSEREGRSIYYKVIEPHLQQIMDCIVSRFS